jgi:hypothetical protein
MKRPSRIQKVPTRPSADIKRTAKRTAPQKAAPLRKGLASTQPVAVRADPILQAQQEATAAEAEVAKISRARLATLTAAPPRQRMAHLADPELTPADRTELEHSVRAALPRSIPITSAPSKLVGYPRRLLRACGYRCAVATVLLVAGVLLAGEAWHNTGERMVGSNTTWIVDWHLPDGSVKHGAWNARLPMVAVRPHNGKVVLKYWLNGLGYATTEVDENWLLGNSFDYVVAPTGGTGAVSPASR